MSPRSGLPAETGATTTVSPSSTFGCMLRPSARKRTRKPSSSAVSHTTANCRESRDSGALGSLTVNRLHCTFVREKSEDSARNFLRYAVEKSQGELQASGRVMRHETAGEKFGSGAPRRQSDELRLVAVFQQIQPGQR